MSNEKLISDLQSGNKDVRFAAWRAAGEADAPVVAELGKLIAASDPGVAKAAREALTTLTHSVGKDPAHPKRASVVTAMVRLTEGSHPLAVRVLAFRLLSGIASESDVPALAKGLQDPAVREDAVYCVERIPGPASNKALLAAYGAAKDDFKLRILAALGHRKAQEGVAISLEAMRSTNAELAAAGAKAFGRIGRKPAGAFAWPKNVDTDAVLRYADAQRDQGNTADAMKLYQAVLQRPEEHLQCAAVVGLSRMRTAEAAAILFPLLKSQNRKVRITAANAWKAMAG